MYEVRKGVYVITPAQFKRMKSRVSITNQWQRILVNSRHWKLVLEYFTGDKDKTFEWFETPNPDLDRMIPIEMIKLGRGKKLLAFIEGQLK